MFQPDNSISELDSDWPVCVKLEALSSLSGSCRKLSLSSLAVVHQRTERPCRLLLKL